MPYPAQINHDSIIETAFEMLETEGFEQLTLGNLAKALGVKAPSLYRHFENKSALLQGVNLVTSQKLVDAIQQAIASAEDDPPQAFREMMHAYRNFAHHYPIAYTLAFNTLQSETRPDPMVLENLVLPLQALMAKLVGEEDSLPALRGAWALVHGFVTLELNMQFQRSGDVAEAFDKAVRAFLAGWQQ